jgi:hypothetical protein
MNRPRPILIVLALVLLLCAGCNRITFGYDHADWLLRHWINDYTSFDTEQKDQIKADVADYMRWHRKVALPEYIAFLQYLEALANRDSALQTADIVHIRSEISRLYKFTMTPFVRPAAHVLSTLDERQIEELRKTLSEQNHEQRDEMLSGNTQEELSRREDGYIHFVESLAGHLSKEQEDKIREMSMRIPFVTGYYIERREAMQVRLILLLRSHAGEDKIAALFEQWIDAPPVPATPQERQAFEAYDKAMNEMIAGISELLTAQQRVQLRKTIADHIDDFQHLHAETGSRNSAHSAPPVTPHNLTR